MELKKQELTKRIAGQDILLSKLKYSILYLLSIERKNKQGKIVERYVKWGRTTNPISRYKQHAKHYIGFDIGYIYLSSDYGHRWIDTECSMFEKNIRTELAMEWEKYSDVKTDKIHGYTEMFIAEDRGSYAQFIGFVETAIDRWKNVPCRNLLDLSYGGSPIWRLEQADKEYSE